MDNQSDSISTLIDKVHAFCSTDPQDFDSRQTLLLTDEEKTRLHHLAWLGLVPWEDYYEAEDFRLADSLWRNPKEGVPSFRTIDQVRAWVRWKETKTLMTQDGREITETVYNRFLPVFRYIRRTISQHSNKPLQQTISHIEEVEFADLHPEKDLDVFWDKTIENLQADAVEHLKWSVEGGLTEGQTELLQHHVFLGKAGVQLVFSVSQGNRKESKAYTLAEAYGPLLGAAAKDLKKGKSDRSPEFEIIDTENDTDARQWDDLLAALKKAFLKWDPTRGPLPAWAKYKLTKETMGLISKNYQPEEQQHEKRVDLEDCEIAADNQRDHLGPEAVVAMREIMIRELGEHHYQRRFIDDISQADLARELGVGSTREAIAKKEQRAKQIALKALITKFD